MTKNDLIQMADLVGYDVDEDEVYAPASGRYGLDPRLEHFAELVAKYVLRYECRDVSTKSQNSDMSEERVHESDKSIHEPWDTSDMSHRSGGLTVEHEIERLKDINQRLVTVAKELGAADDAHEWDDAWSKMCKLMKEHNT
jgi:hypothetical protein